MFRSEGIAAIAIGVGLPAASADRRVIISVDMIALCAAPRHLGTFAELING
jgi:hypothetical protein